MHSQSRAKLFAGLAPNQWKTVFQREDPTKDPVYNYHGLDLFVAANAQNTANVEIAIQESSDGTNWTNRWISTAAIVPGGEQSISVYLQARWHRLLVYSTGTGRVDIQVNIPEDQVIPGLWPDVGTLACATYCEVSDES